MLRNTSRLFAGQHFFAVPQGTVYDRCDAQRRSPVWILQQQQSPHARTVTLSQGKFVVLGAPTVDSSAAPRLWTVGPLVTATATDCDTSSYFLGVDDRQRPFFARGLDSESSAPPEGAKLADARRLLLSLDPVEAARAGHAFQLVSWHDSAKYCGFCGHKTISQKGGASRKCNREGCGKEVFPRTNPVAIMAIESPDGTKLLLGQTKARPIPNMYSVLAGFIDQAETLEDAVRRESMEEAGVLVDTVTYHSSQPWPFPGNLMLGCLCRAASLDLKIDPEEMSDVRWFSREEVERAISAWPDGDIVIPPPYAIAHHLVKYWVEHGHATDAQLGPSRL
jgi:NAD+ diphosphatase